MLEGIAAEISGWEKLAAIATAVGGIAAAVSAFFAWRAAKTSKDTTRYAHAALAASLKPQVLLHITQYGAGEPVVARAIVVGPLSPAGLAGVSPAADVRIEFALASGKRDHWTTELLEPTAGYMGNEPPYLNLVIGEPSAEWPPPEGDHVKAKVSFSDTRGAARYEVSRAADLHRRDESGVVSVQHVTDPVEKRIEP